MTRLVVLGALVLGALVLPRSATAGGPVKVLSVQVDAGATVLTINGENFGSRALRAFLGGIELPVLSQTDSQIQASLPSVLADGSYMLELSRHGAWLATLLGRISVHIGGGSGGGSGGPAGPPGPRGPQGPAGPAGPPGTNALASCGWVVSELEFIDDEVLAACPDGSYVVSGTCRADYAEGLNIISTAGLGQVVRDPGLGGGSVQNGDAITAGAAFSCVHPFPLTSGRKVQASALCCPIQTSN
ncbi:MAG: IPT/TIG domain-containing protein [Myxococcales bacterium]|nr:IPT/TIG domain-containing protein [Myxococcales bacterium]